MLNFERVFVYLERRICMYLLKKEHFCQCTQFFVFIFVKERILLSMHQFLHHWLSSVNSEFGAMAAILFSFWCNFKTVPFGGIFRCHLRCPFCAIWSHFSVAFLWCHFLVPSGAIFPLFFSAKYFLLGIIHKMARLFCLTLPLCCWYKAAKKCCKQGKLFMGQCLTTLLSQWTESIWKWGNFGFNSKTTGE